MGHARPRFTSVGRALQAHWRLLLLFILLSTAQSWGA